MTAKLPLRPPPDYVQTAIFQEYKTIQPTPKCAVNQHGDKVVVKNLGYPTYILRKDYGLMPQYLQKHNEKEKKAQEVAIRAEKEIKETIAGLLQFSTYGQAKTFKTFNN
ncbi:hypothetical protein D4764_18G0001210 [Takifugu flavidus]|uniref:Enkurin n=1 Tax=Takifugu flavidus TaxID=433684 RepID=A0A5C6NQT8_9TELE|nr:hypothetical protein D4764_18G0001210 [Takifugu flavidus]